MKKSYWVTCFKHINERFVYIQSFTSIKRVPSTRNIFCKIFQNIHKSQTNQTFQLYVIPLQPQQLRQKCNSCFFTAKMSPFEQTVLIFCITHILNIFCKECYWAFPIFFLLYTTAALVYQSNCWEIWLVTPFKHLCVEEKHLVYISQIMLIRCTYACLHTHRA